MTGTRDSLVAKVGEIVKTGAVRRRILQTIFPMLLTFAYRSNFKQLSKWSTYNEGTLHNWFKKDLALVSFNRELIDRHGSGAYIVIFDPSYLPKSGKRTPGLGRYWSGQAGAVKRGLELGGFAVGDVGHHTAFHLGAFLTPSAGELKQQGKTLMAHYVGLVAQNKSDILHFGGDLVCDGYFGVSTFVNPVAKMGLALTSCLKSNAALYYPPAPLEGKKGKGRPRVKGAKVHWGGVDDALLPLLYQDGEKRVRAGELYVKCLGRVVLLAAVEYLREDGSMQCRKLYFTTDTRRSWQWVLESYGLRFQIEFLFRDAKQFTGLTHCQSTDKTKIENHLNLALCAVSVAKAAHWLPVPKEERGAFSMAELKTYYHNLALVERFSIALGLNPTETKNNPKIKELLFSSSYDAMAA